MADLLCPQGNTHNAQGTKMALMQFADNVGQDQCAHLCRLNREFSVRRHML